MTSTDLQQPDPDNPVRQELVSYLDGELDAEQSRAVERRLAEDPEYREQLLQLERVWDVLDELPEQTVDDAFTRSTVEMVAVAAEKEVDTQQQELPRKARRTAVLVAGLVLASLFGAFLVTAAIWPDDNRRLVRDLRVIERLDQYQLIGDMDFLRSLLDGGILEVEPLVAEQLPESPRLPSAGLSRKERREYIRQLSSAEKALLSAKLERFKALPRSEQAKLRELDRRIHEASDTPQLLAAIDRYTEWVTELSSGQRAEIAAAEDRLEAAKRVYGQWQREQVRSISPEDMKVLLIWLEEFLYEHRDVLARRLPVIASRRQVGEQLQRLERLPAEQRRVHLLRVALMLSKVRGWRVLLGTLEDADVDAVVARLSPEAQRKMDVVGSPEHRRRLLVSWLEASLRMQFNARRSGADGFPVSGEELEAFFADELTHEEQEQLLALPADAWQRRLRQLYLEKHFGPQRSGGPLEKLKRDLPSGPRGAGGFRGTDAPRAFGPERKRAPDGENR